MTENKQDKEAARETTRSKGQKIGHWVRIAVCLLSGGFIFPHAFTEYDEDARKDSAEKTTRVRAG